MAKKRLNRNSWDKTKLSELALSVRAVNICGRRGLTTLEKLLYHFYKYKTFKNVPGCGETTEKELIEKCKCYLPVIVAPLEVVKENEALAIFDQLSPFKKTALNHHIDYLSSSLSVRSRNGFYSLFGTAIDSKTVVEELYSPSFSFYSIRSIGEKSVSELELFKNQLFEFIASLVSIQDKALSKEYIKITLKSTFKAIENDLDQVFTIEGKIKVFQLISFLIVRGQLFKSNEKVVFDCCFSTDGHSLAYVADKLGVTKERVRQLRVSIEENLPAYFAFIPTLGQDNLVAYEIPGTANFRLVTDEVCQRINNAEAVNYGKYFCAAILNLLQPELHSILHRGKKMIEKSPALKEVALNNCYLITTRFFESFNFGLLIEDISSKLKERITEAYSIHFEGYLLQFFTGERKGLSEIKEMAETIVHLECDLVIDGDGYLTFERNVKANISEYIYSLLEELGGMTKLEKIAEEFSKRYPEIEISEQTIRNILQKEKGLFIFIGRSSTFGLKKWEQEQEGIKGGTIRDIVEEYLSNENEPKHISEITDYVCQFRDTTEFNVNSNILAAEDLRFKSFPGGFIGLNDKAYENTSQYKPGAGMHFTKKAFQRLSGWKLETVIDYYVSKYDYHPVQIRAIIKKKIEDGDLSLTEENRIILCKE